VTQRLSGKVALVTGGASGLGKAIATRMVSEGAVVTITDLEREGGADTAAQLNCAFSPHDVRVEEDWTRVVEEIEARSGRLDILVNNAGMLGSVTQADPEHASLDSLRRILALNVEGVFLGCRAAIPAMRRAGGGAIVNMSSIAGLRASPQAAAYGASKAAVRQYTKSVARYCAEQKLNVRCNSVHPGDVRTPMWDKAAEEAARAAHRPVSEFIARELADCPLGEFTTPEDVAAAVCFLVSEDARHITGTKMIVDGGILECEGYRAPGRT
jgi:NAD(P)-dependent dehydrogenase (short-subunit alcohol dehydrogenase family)